MLLYRTGAKIFLPTGEIQAEASHSIRSHFLLFLPNPHNLWFHYCPKSSLQCTATYGYPQLSRAGHYKDIQSTGNSPSAQPVTMPSNSRLLHLSSDHCVSSLTNVWPSLVICAWKKDVCISLFNTTYRVYMCCYHLQIVVALAKFISANGMITEHGVLWKGGRLSSQY